MTILKSRRNGRSTKVRSAEEARQWLRANGLSASQFARDNNLSLDALKDVLAGRSKANFGKAHAAAVALGMKPSPPMPALSPKTARHG